MEINFDLYKPADGRVLVLKSLPADLVAAREHVEGGFKWPEKGKVTAPDWDKGRWCGNGLHGWKWGTGDASLRVTDDDAKWLVLSVKEADIVELDGKIKFPTCQILYLGDRETAVKIIQHYAPAGTAIMFSTVTGGDGATVTGGYGALLMFHFQQWVDGKGYEWKRKIAIVDGVNYLPGVKYRLLNDEIVAAPDQNKGE